MRTELARQEALLKALLGREDPRVATQRLVGLGLRGVGSADDTADPTADPTADSTADSTANRGPTLAPPFDLDAGLQAYRGNAVALSERALAGAFPHLAARLGVPFASLAWAFWRRCPPGVGDLGAWGAALPDFLRETADDTLAGIAAFEWALHQAERATDATLDAASLGLLNGDPAELGLVLRPGLVLLELPDAALAALDGHRAWLTPQQREPAAVAHEAPADDAAGLAGRSRTTGDSGRATTPVLVWRKDWRGRATHLEAAAAAFMRSALAGASIETALSHSEAAQAVPEARAGEFWDFTVFLHQALQDQWLMAVRRLDAAHGEEDCNDGSEFNAHPDPDPDAGTHTAASAVEQRLPHEPG